jgi:hypothetical protein
LACTAAFDRLAAEIQYHQCLRLSRLPL